jgi:hypothetical protein
LKAAKYVDANDPLTDPRTAGYVETYVKPLGITSMLDVAVQASGRTFGLICFEHVGKAHVWEKDEISFAGQLADKVALAITNKGRIAAEQALRSSERQLSNALAMARAGGWEFDPAKNLFTFNDNFYRIFGTTVEAVGSYTMSPEAYARRFVHPDDIAVVGKEVAAAIATKDPSYSRELGLHGRALLHYQGCAGAHDQEPRRQSGHHRSQTRGDGPARLPEVHRGHSQHDTRTGILEGPEPQLPGLQLIFCPRCGTWRFGRDYRQE